MVDIEDLARRFVVHVASLKSARFACSVATGIEGWFRVEVTPVLQEMRAETIKSRFEFPDRGQADLAVETHGHLCVFEFMCLVEGADAKKLKRLPIQLDRLENGVRSAGFCQGLAFVTLQYPRSGLAKVNRLVDRFFAERGWKGVGPRPLYEGCTLQFYLGSVTAGACQHVL